MKDNAPHFGYYGYKLGYRELTTITPLRGEPYALNRSLGDGVEGTLCMGGLIVTSLFFWEKKLSKGDTNGKKNQLFYHKF